ncbi:hypothetical protein [Sporocytophaga myxococcoides]|uniref:hypothetical protein n=1 Tax=Sporocytophaga myxococcoides TaxID=153721 RepID=UPI000405CE0B|nr:hypothetical protein [Sporocytophaga myxococcoides]
MIARFIKWIFGKKNNEQLSWPEIPERNPEIIRQTMLVLKTLLSEGKEIKAEWNAGGDDTCCDVFINGEPSYKHQDFDICEVVRLRIIDLLNLPNAGEEYHMGKGTICLNEKEEVGMRFTSREHAFGHHINEFTQWNMEETPELKNNLHKVEVSFSGSVDLESERIAETKIETIYGEPILLNAEQLEPIKNRLNDLLDKYESQLGAKVDGQELSNIYVKGTLGAEPLTSFQIEKYYDKSFHHKDEFISLM